MTKGVFLSSKLSGTVQSAIQAREMLAGAENKVTVETLEFLRRGGRVSSTQAMAGTILNIKPILAMRDGKIESVEKIRTRQKAIQRMIELTADRIHGRTPVRIAVTHANSKASAATLLESACGHFDPVETLISPLSPVIGTHAGPGTVALNFMYGIS